MKIIKEDIAKNYVNYGSRVQSSDSDKRRIDNIVDGTLIGPIKGMTSDEARKKNGEWKLSHDPYLFSPILWKIFYLPQEGTFKRWLYDHIKSYRERYLAKAKPRLTCWALDQRPSLRVDDPYFEDLIVNMKISGDFTLRESLYIATHSCRRCYDALLYKYCGRKGYSEDSDEYQRATCRCEFCSGIEEDDIYVAP